jgi:hypothetical protein
MNAREVVGVLFGLSTGCYCVILSLQLAKRKPMLFSLKYLRLFSLLLIFLSTAGPIVGAITTGSEVFWVFALLGLLTSATVFGLLAILGDFWAFNVTHRILLESLEQALQKQGLGYAKRETSGLFRMRHCRVVLSGGESWVGMTTSFGRGFLRVKGSRYIPDYGELLAEFRAALELRDFEEETALPTTFLILGVVLIGAVIFGLISRLGP